MATPNSRRSDETAHFHPTRDRSDRFATDHLIRSLGYQIFRRKSGRPTLWASCGRVYGERQILESLDREQLDAASRLEAIYARSLDATTSETA